MKQENFKISELINTGSGKKFFLEPGNCIMISCYGGNWLLRILPQRYSSSEDAFGFRFEDQFVPDLSINAFIGSSRKSKIFDAVRNFVLKVVSPMIISDSKFLQNKEEYYFILS